MITLVSAGAAGWWQLRYLCGNLVFTNSLSDVVDFTLCSNAHVGEVGRNLDGTERMSYRDGQKGM